MYVYVGERALECCILPTLFSLHYKSRANTAKSKHSLLKSNSTGVISSFYNVCTLSFCSVQIFIWFQNIIFLKGRSQSCPLLWMRQISLTWAPQVHTQATGLRLISLKRREKCPSPTGICLVLVITALLVHYDLTGEPEWLGRAGDGSECFQSMYLTAINTVIGPPMQFLIR